MYNLSASVSAETPLDDETRWGFEYYNKVKELSDELVLGGKDRELDETVTPTMGKQVPGKSIPGENSNIAPIMGETGYVSPDMQAYYGEPKITLPREGPPENKFPWENPISPEKPEIVPSFEPLPMDGFSAEPDISGTPDLLPGATEEEKMYAEPLDGESRLGWEQGRAEGEGGFKGPISEEERARYDKPFSFEKEFPNFA